MLEDEVYLKGVRRGKKNQTRSWVYLLIGLLPLFFYARKVEVVILIVFLLALNYGGCQIGVTKCSLKLVEDRVLLRQKGRFYHQVESIKQQDIRTISLSWFQERWVVLVVYGKDDLIHSTHFEIEDLSSFEACRERARDQFPEVSIKMVLEDVNSL